MIAEGSYTQHMAINAAKLVTMRDDARLREIVAGCELVSADGQASSGPRGCSATRCPSAWRAST